MLLRCFLARSEASVAGLRGEGRDGVGEKGGDEEEAIVCMVSPLDAGVTEIVVVVVLLLVGAGTGIGGAGGLRRRGGGGGGGLLPVSRLGRNEAGAEMARVDADTDIAGDDAVGAGSQREAFSSVFAAVGTGERGNDNSGIVGDMGADRDRTGCARWCKG